MKFIERIEIMKFIGRKYLDKFIDVNYEDDDCLTGVLKEGGHRFRVLFPEKKEDEPDFYSVILQFGRDGTFDRWANSTNFEKQIMDYHVDIFEDGSKKEAQIEKDIDEAFELVQILFKSIPEKFWSNPEKFWSNSLLRIEY